MVLDTKAVRKRLDNERARLEEELRQLETNVSNSDERREGSPFGKREEEATEALELEKRLALENRIRGQLTEIDHAIHKLETGTYGRCDVCGRAIDPARMEALPQASVCMSCKAKNAKPKIFQA